MKYFPYSFSIIFTLFLCLSANAQPKLVKHGKATQLMVNDKPMLIIGGEMGNSSASTLADVQRHFSHLHKLGLNTVLVPAYWNLIEPIEGQYDFSTIDNVITEARKNDLKVVFLWFGVWKNSMSCYAPEWFKADTKRFPRAHSRVVKDGKTILRPVEEASSLSRNVLEADKHAFCQLMQYIKEKDSREQTVIMMQVENEIGMIDVPRDYSPDAEKLYREWLKENGGEYADMYTEERFQAWTYARYVEEIAHAGRQIYDIPMYVNVALNSRNRLPGQYPSAGPLAHLADIWKKHAPSIDIMGLDLYDSDYRGWTDLYHMPSTLSSKLSPLSSKLSNPLFIPEIRLDDNDAVRALYAFGHHSALGFCPFSIEDYPLYTKSSSSGAAAGSSLDLTLDDQINAFTSLTSNLSPISSSYHLLRQIEHLILEKQGTSDIYGVHLDNELREQTIVTADGIRLIVRHSLSLGWEPESKSGVWPEAGCIIIRQGKNDYLVLGSDIVITYEDAKHASATATDGQRIGLASCEVVEYQNGSTTPTVIRHLSGDQTHQGRHVRIAHNQWQIQHFRLYRF